MPQGTENQSSFLQGLLSWGWEGKEKRPRKGVSMSGTFSSGCISWEMSARVSGLK